MKYTSLFSAVAVAAAMSTSAFATVTTNEVASIDFEGNSYPVGTMVAAQLEGWTVQAEDTSSIIYAPLSEADTVEGYTANKHLKLNTEGTELKWIPGTIEQPKAIIEMKVRLVASDTAPAISDTDVHAAVYLKVADGDDHTDDGLYAYTATGWDKLDTSAFNADLATGSMVALRVLMDYNARTATYEGALLADAENDTPIYHGLGQKNMANANHAQTQGHLASISFKGTGGVDDLFVSQIEETASTATLAYNVYDESDLNTIAGAGSSSTLDTVDPASEFTGFVDFDQSFSGLVVKSVLLFDVTDGGNVSCSWTQPPAIDSSTGDFAVTMSNYTFVVDHSYLIKIVVGVEDEEPTYKGPKSGAVQVLTAADEVAYEAAAAGNEYVPLSFTSFNVNGSTVTATLAGTFLVDDNGSSAASFVLVTQTTLGGEEDKQTVSGTLTVTGEHAATLSFEMPQGDTSRFIKGLYVADPQN